MKHQTALVCAILFLVVAPQPITAHSLKWGVSVGETFVYALQRRVVNGIDEDSLRSILPFVTELAEGQKVTMQIDALENIPNEINNNEIPKALCSLHRENDSAIIAQNYSLLVVPIGDWALLTQAENSSSQVPPTFINTATEWGYSMDYAVRTDQTVFVHLEYRYEKTNGTLTYLRIQGYTQQTTLLDIIFVQWHQGMPTVLPEGPQISSILIFAVAITAGVMVMLIVYIVIKMKKPLVQQLGE